MEGAVQPIRAPGSAAPVLIRADTLDRYVPCPRDGVWEPAVEPGDAVRAGALIGRLHDFSNQEAPTIEINAACDGYIAMLHLSSRPKHGQTLYVLADEVSWAEVES
jgi:predicted deacylase